MFGPVKPYISSLETINTSNVRFRDILQGKYKDKLPPSGYVWVDVRDVAVAHVAAFEKPEAAGKRFFITNDRYSNQLIADIIIKNFPEYKDLLPKTREPNDGLETDVYGVDNSRSREVLGIKYHSLEECVVDSVKALKELGL